MFMSMIIFTISLILIIIMLIMLNFVSKKTFSDKEKNSPFECGFDPKTNARLPFSIQFFLIAMIFLIFDVEIVLIMPSIKIMETSQISSLLFSLNIFMMILIFGLYHEWNQGALQWLN